VRTYGAMTEESLDTTDRTAPASKISFTPIFLGLLWLGTSAWIARASYTGGEVGLDGAVGDAIGSLPSTVAATMFTSATVASAVCVRFSKPLVRLLVGLGAGVAFGLLAAVGTRFGYGEGSSITALALVVGAAAVVGGLAGVLPHGVLEAALWATTWVLFAGVIFAVLAPQLVTLFGGGDEAAPAAQQSAQGLAAFTQSAVTGLLAGLHGSIFLRSARCAWGWYPVAGAFGGALLLAAEYLTRLGGAAIVDTLADGSTVVSLSDAARVRHALIVLVVGALMGLVRARRSTPEYD
jgi:hypothetical protein